jgi:PAS domain-containing protein
LKIKVRKGLSVALLLLGAGDMLSLGRNNQLDRTAGWVILAIVFTLSTLFTIYQALQKRQQADDKVQLLQKLILGVSEAPNFDSALSLVLSTVCQSKGWVYGEAWIPSPEENILQCNQVWYDSNQSVAVAQSAPLQTFKTLSQDITFAPGVGLPGRVLASGLPEWREDVSQETNKIFPRHQAASQCGLKTGFGIPVTVSGKVLAVIVFFRFRAALVDQPLVESLVAIAAQLGTLLQRRQAEQALQESERRFHSFINNSLTVAFMKDREGRYVYGNERLEQLFNVK